MKSSVTFLVDVVVGPIRPCADGLRKRGRRDPTRNLRPTS
jgi:hypothetical protein